MIHQINNLSFFEQRMNQLGVNGENNSISLVNLEAESPIPKKQVRPIFKEDKDGNITITFWRLDRTIPTYFINKMGNPREWVQTRMKEPVGDHKYSIPKGQGTYPFLPPRIIEAYEEKREVETLFLTEGAFKAWKACQHGVHTIGLTSITHYRDKETELLHSDIIAFIGACKVRNVVILWDADCRDISEKQLHVGEDISKRPSGFFTAANKIKTLLAESEKGVTTYFGHVQRGFFESSPKGLDDIVLAAENAGKLEEVLAALNGLTKKNPFFRFNNITSDSSIEKLKKYFGLTSHIDFYELHRSGIGTNEFNFRGKVFQYDLPTDTLLERPPAWTKSIRWVGDYFYQILDRPDGQGGCVRELKSVQKGTLKELHGRDFVKYFKDSHYVGFEFEPDNYEYRENINGFFNRYTPIQFSPSPGGISNVLKMLKHIFGERPIEYKGATITSHDLALDYCQLLITQPKQKLPVIFLYSKARNTGKSTFPIFLQTLLGANAYKANNEDLMDRFNEAFADKLLIWCDETLLEKKKDSERIKDLSTAKTFSVNPKGKDKYQQRFYAKFIFCGNNLNMVFTDKHENRYWINEVPPLKNDDPFFLEKLGEEIPAFLHFLQNRELVTEREGRMFFHPSLIKTDAFFQVAEKNEPGDVKRLREILSSLFLIDKNGDEIRLSPKNIDDHFFGGKKGVPWIKEIVTDYLGVPMDVDENGRSKVVKSSFYKYETIKDYPKREYSEGDFNYSSSTDEIEYSEKIVKVNLGSTRPYIFKKELFG